MKGISACGRYGTLRANGKCGEKRKNFPSHFRFPPFFPFARGKNTAGLRDYSTRRNGAEIFVKGAIRFRVREYSSY